MPPRSIYEMVSEPGVCSLLILHQLSLQGLIQYLYSSLVFSLKIHKNPNQQNTFAQARSPFSPVFQFFSGENLLSWHH